MNYKKNLVALVSISFCLFIYTNAYCQITTPAEWERIRKQREAKEARDRADSKYQEQQKQKNTTSKPSSSNSRSSNQDVVYEFIAKNFDENGLKPMKLYGKWGLTNSITEVVPPIYDGMYNFSGKFYAIKATDPENRHVKRIGFMDKYGKIIIPIQFDEIITNFKNGIATVVLNNERFQIDETGKTVGTKTIHIVPLTENEKQSAAKQQRDKSFESGIIKFNKREWYAAKEEFKSAYGDPERRNTIDFYLIGCMIEPGYPKDYDAMNTCKLIIDYKNNGGKNPRQYYYIGYLLDKKIDALGGLVDSIIKTYGYKTPLDFYKKYESIESVSQIEKTTTFLEFGKYYLGNRDTTAALHYFLKELDLLNKKKHEPSTSYSDNVGEMISNIYFNQNDLQSLISFLTLGASTNSYLKIVNLLIRQSDFKTALFYLETAFRTNESEKKVDPYGSYGLRGYIYYKLKMNSEALADFTKSINSEYSKSDSYYFRSLIHEELGNHIQACADLSNAKKDKSPYYTNMEEIDKACKKCSKRLLK